MKKFKDMSADEKAELTKAYLLFYGFETYATESPEQQQLESISRIGAELAEEKTMRGELENHVEYLTQLLKSNGVDI